nr:endonuclease [uncultured Bacteroides sp.]
MFWNVENLFDCKHDTLKHDEEFLPTSMRAWHYGRYKKKLANIARTITAIGQWTPPALVGLCEVENDSVLRDLTRYSPLKKYNYRYVMTNSPDMRGIDVALLYQRGHFKLLSYHSIRIPFSGKHQHPTRDILHVIGLNINNDSLDVFVVHLPSRSGGQKASEPNRIRVAETLKAAVDSLFLIRAYPKIIIMGDFNDYPYNKSISKILEAVAPPKHPEPQHLYNLLADKAKTRNFGSYKYQGEWGLLDQLIVSGTLLTPTGNFTTSEAKANVARLPFLLTKDEKYGGEQPFRTYNGIRYQGGFSDHLPVYLDFSFTPSE